MTDLPSLYGGVTSRRVTPRDLQGAKERDERWAMLTSYDMLTAALFEQAGIPVLLIGDSAGNNVLGYATTIPVTVDELLPMVRAVVRSTSRPLVVAGASARRSGRPRRSRGGGRGTSRRAAARCPAASSACCRAARG